NPGARKEFEVTLNNDGAELGIGFAPPVPLFGSDVNADGSSLGDQRGYRQCRHRCFCVWPRIILLANLDRCMIVGKQKHREKVLIFHARTYRREILLLVFQAAKVHTLVCTVGLVDSIFLCGICSLVLWKGLVAEAATPTDIRWDVLSVLYDRHLQRNFVIFPIEFENLAHMQTIRGFFERRKITIFASHKWRTNQYFVYRPNASSYAPRP